VTSAKTTWDALEAAISSREPASVKGQIFERFCVHYLKTFSQRFQIEELYFPNVDGQPFPRRVRDHLRLGVQDTGIDGVFIDTFGRYTAVQSKFRTERGPLTFRELSTFWSDAERADYRLVFTNCDSITRVSARRRGHLEITCSDLLDLESDMIKRFNLDRATSVPPRSIKKTPRDYQRQALDDVKKGFQSNNRGKLIAACGIGKTLLSLWIHEELRSKSTIFVAPSLYLIRQTIAEWTRQARSPFSFIAICSDATVTNGSDGEEIAVSFDTPTTTEKSEIKRFLEAKDLKHKVVFVTYQSFDVLCDVASRVNDFEPDLMILDESHRTAGVNLGSGFRMCLLDDHLRVKRRLFMTATERVYSARLRASMNDESLELFSMDDHAIYGPRFHRLSFSEAIKKKIISDYRIVVAVLRPSDIREIIDRFELIIDESEVGISRPQLKNHIVHSALIRRVMNDLGVAKFVSYHSSVKDAKNFANVINQQPIARGRRIDAAAIDGSMSSGERKSVISEFEASSDAVLANARCLIEGIDIPVIDGILFAAPKQSLVDIVQAIGRALRKESSSPDKLSYVVIPVLLTSDEVDVSDSEFDHLFNVIQALRDQDDGVAEQIDRLNLGVATGGTRTPTPDFVQPMLPGLLDIGEFERQLVIRIAEVNRNPTGTHRPAGTLGSGERTSAIARRMKTLGDYTPTKYQESLIDPTVRRFRSATGLVARASLRVNNNNIAHSQRLGVIKQRSDGRFALTAIGEQYRSGSIQFEDLFRNQMLLYRDPQFDNAEVFPYRMFLNFLIQVESIRYWDFLFGFYLIDSLSASETEIRRAQARIESARRIAPNPHIAGDRARRDIFESLKQVVGSGISYNDVWTDRTTTGNQFRYFTRHVELYDDMVTAQGAGTRLEVATSRDGIKRAREYLRITEPLLSSEQYGSTWWIRGRP